MSVVRNINNALNKNRRILQGLILDGSEQIEITRDELMELGFRFKFSTHVKLNCDGIASHFCYDYGYMMIEKDYCRIVKVNLE